VFIEQEKSKHAEKYFFPTASCQTSFIQQSLLHSDEIV
jgi:hypothetical protein